MTPDPAQVAALIVGPCSKRWNGVKHYCGHHMSNKWPCSHLRDATEVVRAALERAWGDGNDRYLDTNPYRKEKL